MSVPNPPYWQSSMLAALPHVRHGFFGRMGGVSEGGFSSLNVTLKCADQLDQKEHVAENRRRILRAIDAPLSSKLHFLNQVRGSCVHILADDWQESLQGDALVTQQVDHPIAMATADCVPVLIATTRAPFVVAAIHSGWQGTVGGIVPHAIDAVKKITDEHPSFWIAAIGPCIRQPYYEVGRDVYEPATAPSVAVMQQLHVDAKAFFQPAADAGKWLMDVPGLVAAQLRALGVIKIDDCGLDTYSLPDVYYSHRRLTHQIKRDPQGAYGRGNQASVIMLANNSAMMRTS